MSVALGFACFGVIIGIWALLSYTGLALSLGFANLHNPFFLPSPGTVTKTLYVSERAGGTIVRPAGRADWGGTTGAFADPEGYVWEIAHNPAWTLKDDGTVRI